MSYNDTRLRQELKAPETALLSAYERGTGRRALLTYDHTRILWQLVKHETTPDDITLLIRYVKRRMRAKDKPRKIGQYSEASLQFHNLLGDTSKFLDTLHTAKIEIVNMRERKMKLVSVTRAIGDGDTITRLEPEPAPLASPVRDELASFFSNLANQMKGVA